MPRSLITTLRRVASLRMNRAAHVTTGPAARNAPRRSRRRIAIGGGVLVGICAVVLLVGYRELGSRPFLAVELTQMANDDRAARRALADFGPVQVGRELSDEHTAAIERTEELDRRHADRLKEIIDDHGWPGRSLVGRSGAHAAWLIAQHATHDPAFQRRVLGLMAGRSDVDQGEVAKLVDRLRAWTGQDQIYGTQWTCRDGRLELVTKLEDPGSVDALRASVGLETLEEDRERILRRDGPCPPT
ncbi:MAG: DUF6624 domain-containing protein [Microthrixaceae bacterium]